MAKGDLAKGLNQRDKASRGRFLSSCVTVKLKEIVLDIVLLLYVHYMSILFDVQAKCIWIIIYMSACKSI